MRRNSVEASSHLFVEPLGGDAGEIYANQGLGLRYIRSTAMDLQTELFLIIDALDEERIDYAVCDGIAVVIHGYPRLTRDIGILIRPEDLDRVKIAVSPAGYTIASGIIPFDVGQPGERQLFRLTKVEGTDHLILDLLLVGPSLESAWTTREEHRIDERVVHVVSRDGLATMKRAAGRPQDIEDLKQLGLDLHDS